MIKGRVIRNTGSHYVVRTDDGQHLPCKVKGNFRIRGIRTTNPVAVGDFVEIENTGAADTWLIRAITPRRNYIIRRASNLSKESHIIASNLDQAALIVTLAHPVTSTVFIDRFLATAEAYNVPAFLVINKIDLLTDPEDKEFLAAVKHLYNTVGYDVLEVSARTGEGIDALTERLHDRVTLFSGNSGVGKSTLINRLIPGADAREGEISEAHDAGMHTTTFSELYVLPGGGDIIDTPGIRGFGTIDFDRYETAHYFPDLFEVSRNCRFDNCTHTHEPGCAVQAAVEAGEIAPSRYASYLSIISEIDDAAKYRK